MGQMGQHRGPAGTDQQKKTSGVQHIESSSGPGVRSNGLHRRDIRQILQIQQNRRLTGIRQGLASSEPNHSERDSHIPL